MSVLEPHLEIGKLQWVTRVLRNFKIYTSRYLTSYSNTLSSSVNSLNPSPPPPPNSMFRRCCGLHSPRSRKIDILEYEEGGGEGALFRRRTKIELYCQVFQRFCHSSVVLTSHHKYIRDFLETAYKVLSHSLIEVERSKKRKNITREHNGLYS